MDSFSFGDAGDLGVHRAGIENGEWISCEVAQEGFKVVVSDVYGTEQEVLITLSDLREHAKTFEDSTGNCWECKGSGEAFASWSVLEGVTYQVCDRCKGKGLRPRR